MVYVVIAIAWLAFGAAVGLIEARRGSWRHGWLVSAFFGPLSLPLAHAWRRAPAPEAVLLTRPKARRGKIDILVGIDGSSASLGAGLQALRLFGPRVRRVTLAAVLDLDTAAPHADSVLYPDPWPEELAARGELTNATEAVRTSSGHDPGSVILAGVPAAELERYAKEEGYEVIVVGCRGKGLSKFLLGSCASRLACKTSVPVLLIPGTGALPVEDLPNQSSPEPVGSPRADNR